MTEAEWLVSGDPVAMLNFVLRWVCPGNRDGTSGQLVSDRKLRLFAVACCRAVWPLLTDKRSRQAVEVAERMFDRPDEAEIYRGRRKEVHARAAQAVWDCRGDPNTSPVDNFPWCLATAAQWCITADRSEMIADQVVRFTQKVLAPASQADLAREIVGNPFRSLAVDLGWLTPTVHSLAQAAYDERLMEGVKCWYCNGSGLGQLGDGKCGLCRGSGRVHHGCLDPHRLLVLSDALEEAGCAESRCENCLDGDIGCPKCEGAGYFYDPPYSLNRIKCSNCDEGLLPEKCSQCNGSGVLPHPIIAHLRSPGPHYRGCHVVDLLLGKE